MYLSHIQLRAFRSHKNTTVTFTPKVNVIYGANGVGKTNILEAIHYLCLTKSFLVSKDDYVLKKGEAFFEVQGEAAAASGRSIRVRVAYVPDEGKSIFVNGARLERLTDMVGKVPVVVCSPEDYALTSGGPELRRRFLNNILSQARPVYMTDLMKYRRALRQRNELLGQYRRTRFQMPEGVLSSWNAEVVALGSRIVASRWRFIQRFSAYLKKAYEYLGTAVEEPTITYQTIVHQPHQAIDEIADAYRTRLASVEKRERDLGRTLVGPHRDELVFKLDSFEVRRYASQGQHRTFGMALKLAKYFYLKAEVEEKPLLLLDDVFGNLDAKRTRVFLELLQSDAIGQSIVTAAQPEPFLAVVPFQQPEHQALELRPEGVTDQNIEDALGKAQRELTA